MGEGETGKVGNYRQQSEQEDHIDKVTGWNPSRHLDCFIFVPNNVKFVVDVYTKEAGKKLLN